MFLPLSKAKSTGDASCVAGPEIVRSGAAFPVLVLAVSKIRTELAPLLATKSRLLAVSASMYWGEDNCVAAPEMVAPGVMFPVAVRALSKRTMLLLVGFDT